MFGSPNLREETMVSSLCERDAGTKLAHVANLACKGDDGSLAFAIDENQLTKVIVAIALNLVFSWRKQFAVHDKIVGNVYDEMIRFLSLRRHAKPDSEQRHHEPPDQIPFHAFLLFVWSGSCAPFAAGMRKTAVSTVSGCSPKHVCPFDAGSTVRVRARR